jgi:hypothetical protein
MFATALSNIQAWAHEVLVTAAGLIVHAVYLLWTNGLPFIVAHWH